jgi:hypothetical protein
VEETGAAQHLRDARIAPIYEGTNGIQAIDLVTRKLPQSDGACVATHIAELRAIADAVKAANDPAFGLGGARLAEAIDALDRATQWMLGHVEKDPDAALAGATPYLRLFGLASGGCLLASEALAAQRLGDGADASGRVSLARFFAENLVVAASGLERSVIDGADSVNTDAALRE